MQRAGLVVPIGRKSTNMDAWPATRMWDQSPAPGEFKGGGGQAVELRQFSELRCAIIDTSTRTPASKTHKFDEIQVPQMRVTSPKRER
jgi:hypothetical protein